MAMWFYGDHRLLLEMGFPRGLCPAARLIQPLAVKGNPKKILHTGDLNPVVTGEPS
jgi:hypothetical protein